MADCPECDADVEVDEFDVDRGDIVGCPECGSSLEVISLSPIELELAPDEDESLDDGDEAVVDGDGDEEEDEDWQE